jgi:exopolysaccharide production protein ExoZ
MHYPGRTGGIGQAMDRLYSIQYLRAIAAIGVVVFHSLSLHPPGAPVGAAGVDIFFVISGFIMTTLMLGPEARPGVFLRRRLARIVPLYWAASLLAVAIALVRPAFDGKTDPSFYNTILTLLFIPHVSRVGGYAPVLTQGWTLEYEMFFYLLCTGVLFLPAANRLKTLVGVLVGLVALGLVLAPQHHFFRVYTHTLLLEFVAGIAIALAWRAGWRMPVWLAAAAIAIGVAALAAQQIGVLPIAGWRAVRWGVPAALIVWGALHLEGAGLMPRSRFGALLGDASYVTYLGHTFVLSALYWYFPGAPDWARVTGCVVGVSVLAIAGHLWFEMPLNRLLRGRRTPSLPVAAASQPVPPAV